MGSTQIQDQGVFGNISKRKTTQGDEYRAFLDILGEYNKETLDTSNSKFIDLTRDSSNKYIRDTLNELTKPKTIQKDEVLGVVLKVVQVFDDFSENYIAKVYVDVPSVSFEGVGHPDIFFDPRNNNQDDWEHKAFYVDERTLKSLPKRGDVVKVKLAPDYPSHSNPRDNRYIGVFKDHAVLPSTDKRLVVDTKKRQTITLEQYRESLVSSKYKPKEITEDDLIGFPFRGLNPETKKPFSLTSMPALRRSPPNGAAEAQGLANQYHIALDIGMPIGTPIYSVTKHSLRVVLNSTVTNADKPSFGFHIVGENDKYTFVYAHLSEVSFDSSEVFETEAGQIIGYSGNSGGRPSTPYAPHLHFAMYEGSSKNGRVGGLRQINPLYFLKGTLDIEQSFVDRYGLKSRFLNLPLALDARYDDYRYFFENNETFQKENNPIRTELDYSESGAGQSLISRSKPASSNKLILADFECDLAKGVQNSTNRGFNKIKIREDLVPDLIEIKQILNNYGISFSLLDQQPSFENNNISFLAKVGLEIKLNMFAALQENINNNISDYLIGPDYSNPFGFGFKLKVYAPIRRDIEILDRRYIPELKNIDIYDITGTYLKQRPKIIKINKKVLNLTKILEDYGFFQVMPKQEFFLKSDFSKSNWFYFYKPNKIIKGYTYKELLETVYESKNKNNFFSTDVKWDGSKFI